MCADSPSQDDTSSMFDGGVLWVMSPWDNDSGPHTSWALPVPRSSCPALQPGLNRGFQTDVPAAKYEIPGIRGRERTSSFYVNIRAWFERTKPARSSASRLSELPSEQGHRHTFFFFFFFEGRASQPLSRQSTQWWLPRCMELATGLGTPPLSLPTRNGFYRILTHL